MELWEKIVAEYPELSENNYAEFTTGGSIMLVDDSDGVGVYIKKWEYSKPIPSGLTLGKPSA
jgi:hypothetical protein